MTCLFILRAFARNLLRERIIFFIYRFDAWDTNPSFMPIKPAHYPLDYNNFIALIHFFKVTQCFYFFFQLSQRKLLETQIFSQEQK